MDPFIVITRCFLIFSACYVFPTVFTASVESSKGEGTRISDSKSRVGVSDHHHALIYPSDNEEGGSLNRGGELESPLLGAPSPCPDNALFCAADDYPKDAIKKKLKKQPKLLLDILYEEEIDSGVYNKFGPEPGAEKELCTSSANIVYPNKGKSKEGQFEFIVNDDEHKQGIRVETCTSNGGECNELPANTLPLGYKSHCVQKYIWRTLVVLNQNSTSDVQGFVTKAFEFPSCCSCVISMTVSNYDRFGGETSTTDTNPTAAIASLIKEKPTSVK